MKSLKSLAAVFILLLLLASAAWAQPVITQQPANQTVAVGGTLSLGVTVSGTTPVYQWFKDSRFLVGATNPTLAIANAGMTNSGLYYVAVTNSGGMVISLPASVMVGNPILAAWGTNNYGQLGNGTMNNSLVPFFVASNVVAGAGGYAHSLFTTSDGTLWTMGQNICGQLGNGTTDRNAHPTPISVASNVVAVAAGAYHSLFTKTNGTLWVMGYNSNGQLGNGDPIGTNVFRPISVANNVVAVAGGRTHSLFVKTNGTLWAMGENTYGELGNGSTGSTQNTSICVASNVVAIAAGYYHSLFVKTDGTLWGMGWNTTGQLGDGDSTGTNVLKPICVASNVVAVAAGVQSSLFVKTNGTLWAMGLNNYGQLGNGDPTGTNVFRPVCVASNVMALAAEWQYSMFTKTDGTLWAMGLNSCGQLGNGTTDNAISPIQVSNASSVANIFLAELSSSTLAIGTIHCLATVTLGNLNQTYTGGPISATPSTIPAGLTINLTYSNASYSVSANAPTNAGSYTVIGAISDPNAYGSATNTLVISQASATVTLTNLIRTYDGTAKSVGVTTSPGGLPANLTYSNVSYSASANPPTNADSYSVIGTIANLNYYGGATNTLMVGVRPQNFTGSSTNINRQQLTLQLAGTPYYPYILQCATNLNSPVNWQPVSTNPADVNGNWSCTISNLCGTNCFYRTASQ